MEITLDKLNQTDRQNLLELKLAVENFNEKLESMENQFASRRKYNDKKLSYELEDVTPLYQIGTNPQRGIFKKQREFESDDELIRRPIETPRRQNEAFLLDNTTSNNSASTKQPFLLVNKTPNTRRDSRIKDGRRHNDEIVKNASINTQDLYSPSRHRSSTLIQSYNVTVAPLDSNLYLRPQKTSPLPLPLPLPLNINHYLSTQPKASHQNYLSTTYNDGNPSQYKAPYKLDDSPLKIKPSGFTAASNGLLLHHNIKPNNASPDARKNLFLNRSALQPKLLNGLSGGRVSEDLGRHLSVLVNQLNDYKNTNTKLQTQLEISSEEIRRLKNLLTEKEMLLHQIQSTGKISDAVEDIYKVQRERDGIMLQRLKTLSDDRDSALNLLQDLQQQINRSNTQDGHKLDLDDSVEGLEEQSQILLNLVHSNKTQQRQAVVMEMNALMDEKEKALKEALLLKNELKDTKEKLIKEKEKHMKTIQEKKMCILENSEIVKKCSQLNDEVDSLKLFYNLHSSLSQEAELRTDFENILSRVNDELELAARDNALLTLQKSEAVEVAQKAMDDFESLRSQIKILEARVDEENVKAEKLERLVVVLRRKLTSFEEIQNIDHNDAK